MLPFCIYDPADLHIAYIAAAGFGSFSLMARSNTLLLQMALPCSPFQCCRQLEIDVIDASSCVSVFVVSSLSLLGTTHDQLDNLGKLCDARFSGINVG